MRSPLADIAESDTEKYVPVSSWQDIRTRIPVDKSKFDARMLELDELILAGWGETPAEKIPDNWREVQPRSTAA